MEPLKWIYVCHDTVQVALNYAGINLETQGNYMDYFGNMLVIFRHHDNDKVQHLQAKRTNAVDRGYSLRS